MRITIAREDNVTIVLTENEVKRLKNKLYVVKQLGVKYKIFEELEELLR